MCGINGISEDNSKIIKLMNNSIKHRGPDNSEVKNFKDFTLGHVRLSIIDLSKEGNQPFKKLNYTIVFNGEIYNYVELKQTLIKKGYKFRTKTDTEVIIASYDYWGENCVSKFNGMWAFAIYDSKNKKVFISRDRFGIKPLYYYYKNKKLIFSSEIKAILENKIKIEENKKIIKSYLLNSKIDYNNETFFKNINTLLPGHNLIFNLKNKDIKIKKYYEVSTNKIEISEKEAVSKLNNLFIDSLKLRFRSDVEVGSCLSGGIDSSTIISVSKKQKLANNNFKSFSAVFPGSKINENKYIDLVVKKNNIKNYKIKPTNKDLINDLSNLIKIQEEPFLSPSIYAQYRVIKLAKQNKIKVLLDGQGADELFLGYHTYFPTYIKQLIKDKKYFEIIFSKLFWKYIIHYTKNKPKKVINILFKKQNKIYNLENTKFDTPSNIDKYAKYCLQYNLRSLLKWEDKNTMAFSIESRLPFLDYKLVDFAFSLDYNFKIKKFNTKYILKKSMINSVPKEILNRKDKIGFATPSEWLTSKEFKNLVKEIIKDEKFKKREYWNYKEILKIFNKQNETYFENIWKIINLELWLREFIDIN